MISLLLGYILFTLSLLFFFSDNLALVQKLGMLLSLGTQILLLFIMLYLEIRWSTAIFHFQKIYETLCFEDDLTFKFTFSLDFFSYIFLQIVAFGTHFYIIRVCKAQPPVVSKDEIPSHIIFYIIIQFFLVLIILSTDVLFWFCTFKKILVPLLFLISTMNSKNEYFIVINLLVFYFLLRI